MYKKVLAAALLGSVKAHPVLPTSWTATVSEAEVGIVYESEHFVPDQTQISTANPAAKWTNYTDGSCQRLIYFDHKVDKRFLLGCDAVDCCWEDDDGDRGPIEYQIPNVHPASLAPVKDLGKHTITLFDGSTVTANAYYWKFLIANYSVDVTLNPSDPDGPATLHRWSVGVKGSSTFDNEYVNFTAVQDADMADFVASFKIPNICTGNIVNCGDARRQGLLSDRSYNLLHAGNGARLRLP